MTAIDFPLPYEELVAERAPMAFRLAGWSIAGLIAIGILGSAIYRIDVYATAPGRVEPSGRSKSIQAPEAAMVKAMLVNEGSHVWAGQDIVRLDPTASIYDRDAAQAQAWGLSSEISRLETEVKAVEMGSSALSPIAFDADIPAEQRARERAAAIADLAQLSAERLALEEQVTGDRVRESVLEREIAAKSALVPINAQRLHNREVLNQEGWKSASDVAEAHTDLSHAVGDLLDSRRDLAEAREDELYKKAQITAGRAKFIKDRSDQIQEDAQKLAQQSGDFRKNRARTQNMTIKSPVSGTVQSIQVASIGQIANVGQALLTIVPDATKFNVQALISDRDMGFINIGDRVAVKVRAFPFTRYGVVYGIIRRISHDSLESKDGSQSADSQSDSRPFDQDDGDPLPHVSDLIYTVDVDLQSKFIVVDGQRVQVKPGMGVEVEIQTGKRTLLEYIFSPIAETLRESGHER